jgi:hypothetical protein
MRTSIVAAGLWCAKIRIKSIQRLQSYCSRMWTFFTVTGAAALTETDELEQVIGTHV